MTHIQGHCATWYSCLDNCHQEVEIILTDGFIGIHFSFQLFVMNNQTVMSASELSNICLIQQNLWFCVVMKGIKEDIDLLF